MLENKINQALAKLFEKHRIVFWYDAKKELRETFDAFSLPGVEKREIANNEFQLKFTLLRKAPEQKCLLYHEGPQPPDMDNWLLDVLLANGEFRTDQAGIWLSELEIPIDFSDVVETHIEFFRAGKRRESLKRLFQPNDTAGMLRLKMLAVSANSEARMDAILEALLQELAEQRDDKIKLIARCKLDNFLWEQLSRYYGYRTSEPGLQDFAIELFKSCYAMGTNGKFLLNADALVFFKRWKDSRLSENAFRTLSENFADVLNIRQDLEKQDFRELLELDYFRLIDQKVISDLVKAVVNRTYPSTEITLWVRQRRQSHWLNEFEHLYEAIDYAARFQQSLNDAKLEMTDFSDGVQRYCRNWFVLDQAYRKFTYHVRKSGQATLLAELTGQIENLYANKYLLTVNDRWQTFVNALPKWDAAAVPLQRNFYERQVLPFLKKDNKVCVIISDGMRYEIGDELLSLVRQEDRYSAELSPMLSMLPSYTQLGMAALLPNNSLSFADDDSGTVLVDGNRSQGTANRLKILKGATSKRAHALTADQLMALKGEDCREMIRENDVVYVYHNHIDATGDKRDNEERVFEAAEETLQELVRIIKKLTAANANNLLVTADHGFIYQNRAIEESDFSGNDSAGEQILYRDRRFVLGKGLSDTASLHKFRASQLGLTGSMEVHIPKSINRLRLKGSGSRYVHGGASLQEIVIPLLKINKKRQSDISSVAIDIIRGESSVITSGQLAVVFYQNEPVTDKIQPRDLRVGIYTESGELISDSHQLTFDLAFENPRDRELTVKFVFTQKANDANGQEVILKMEENLAGTSHYKVYKSIRYVMRRSFTSDFDY